MQIFDQNFRYLDLGYLWSDLSFENRFVLKSTIPRRMVVFFVNFGEFEKWVPLTEKYPLYMLVATHPKNKNKMFYNLT